MFPIISLFFNLNRQTFCLLFKYKKLNHKGSIVTNKKSRQFGSYTVISINEFSNKISNYIETLTIEKFLLIIRVIMLSSVNKTLENKAPKVTLL